MATVGDNPVKLKIKCLILGCKYTTVLQFWSLGEYLTIQQCERCKSQRTQAK